VLPNTQRLSLWRWKQKCLSKRCETFNFRCGLSLKTEFIQGVLNPRAAYGRPMCFAAHVHDYKVLLYQFEWWKTIPWYLKTRFVNIVSRCQYLSLWETVQSESWGPHGGKDVDIGLLVCNTVWTCR
jgi:hypothetical protein